MRKFLTIVGALFLVLLVAIASFIGYAAYQGRGLDASSKAYVEANVPPIISTWSKIELLKRASPQLQKIVDEKPEKLDQLLQKLSKLGALKSFGDVKGSANIAYTSTEGKLTIAAYVGAAKFENGEGTITVRLIQSPTSGQWQLLYFFVDSPLFLQ